MNPCAWCGAPTALETELEPPVYDVEKVPETLSDGTVRLKSFKVLKKRAIDAWVCQAHFEMVERNRREAEARKAVHEEMLKKRREEKKRRLKGRAA